jgi:lambda family phage portal protein
MAALRESSVLAPDGRPILVAMEPAYRAAGQGRRFAGFPAQIQLGPNAALLPNLEVLRARARALYRNNAIVWGAMEKLVGNLVGWGITPKSLHENEPTRQALATLWADWARQIKLDALQKRACREAMIAGEVFVRVRPRRPDDTDALGRRLVVPLELQLIEAEHCPVWYTQPLENGRFVRAGIEFDLIGRRQAYWMFPDHPGDYGSLPSLATQNTLVPVPAEQVIHLFDPESPEMIRGVPRLSRNLLHADRLESFHDATLERQAIAALFAGFIKRPEGASPPGLLDETPAAPEPILEPGTLSYLADGEDITFPATPDVGSNYQAFVRAMHLMLACGTGTTYEQCSNDLSGVNYSSIRAGALEFRRSCQVWQYTTFCPDFLEPIWVQFLRRAQLAGLLEVPGFAQNELQAGRVEWITQGWEWVDPLKEVGAAEREVAAGFETRRGVNMRRGNDPVRTEQERAAELASAKKLGLQFTTDVPEPQASPAAGGGIDLGKTPAPRQAGSTA